MIIFLSECICFASLMHSNIVSSSKGAVPCLFIVAYLQPITFHPKEYIAYLYSLSSTNAGFSASFRFSPAPHA